MRVTRPVLPTRRGLRGRRDVPAGPAAPPAGSRCGGVGWRHLAGWGRVVCLAVGLGLGSGGAARAEDPPAALLFNQPHIIDRLRLEPAPVTKTGEYRLELVEIDRVGEGSRPGLRILVRVTAVRGTLPAELVVSGPAWALDEAGHRLVAESYQTVATPSAHWLAIELAGQAERLAVFAAAVGPRPQEERRVETLSLRRVGEAWRLPAIGWTVGLALTRLEDDPLPLLEAPTPLYRALENTVPEGPEPAGTGPFWSLRLYTLAPPDGPGEWRLANLRLPTAAGVIDSWRYSRRMWRPDWGGWLGVSGREQAAAAGEPAGVRLEQVRPDGPAATAGLQPDDLLVALNGEPVQDAYDLGETVRRAAPGASWQGEFWRAGQRREVTGTIGFAPLWPELDPAEFTAAWESLTRRAEGTVADPVLSLWDWQTCVPGPAQPPESLELVLTRPGPLQGTTFVFTDLPVSPAARGAPPEGATSR